jgi:hypothetical protein
MVLIIMFPHFPAMGSGGMPPVPPTILMSGLDSTVYPNTSVTLLPSLAQVPAPAGLS